MTPLELWVFGSVTSGEIDAGSDLDVLAICGSEDDVTAMPSQWSIYSTQKLSSLFDRGTLFAWHLYRDAVRVWPHRGPELLKSLGEPAPYSSGPAEIRALTTIADDAFAALERQTPSPIYELGLVYLVSRDIAMAAAPAILGDFSFSRFAPYQYTKPRFPLARAQYDYLISCRRAGTRGAPIEFSPRVVDDILGSRTPLMDWYEALYEGSLHG